MPSVGMLWVRLNIHLVSCLSSFLSRLWWLPLPGQLAQSLSTTLLRLFHFLVNTEKVVSFLYTEYILAEAGVPHLVSEATTTCLVYDLEHRDAE